MQYNARPFNAKLPIAEQKHQHLTYSYPARAARRRGARRTGARSGRSRRRSRRRSARTGIRRARRVARVRLRARQRAIVAILAIGLCAFTLYSYERMQRRTGAFVGAHVDEFGGHSGCVQGALHHCSRRAHKRVHLQNIPGLGISIFEYRYTEILKLFSVIF